MTQTPSTTAQGKTTGFGIGMLVAAAGLFLVCSLIQAAYGSSMFDSTYSDPGFLGSMLVTVTFWPGWLGTVALAASGVRAIFAGLANG